MDLLRKLPLWLIQPIWILLLVAAFCAIAYLVWYLIERKEKYQPKQRGFEIERTGEMPMPLEEKEKTHG
jgi:hypothetical protein